MKNFLKRVKAKVGALAIWTAFVSLVVALVVSTTITSMYAYIKNKVGGAFGWIANKYNAVVTKFKTEVSEETSKA